MIKARLVPVEELEDTEVYKYVRVRLSDGTEQFRFLEAGWNAPNHSDMIDPGEREVALSAGAIGLAGCDAWRMLGRGSMSLALAPLPDDEEKLSQLLQRRLM